MADVRFQSNHGDYGQKEKSVTDIALNNLRNTLIELTGSKDVKALTDPLGFGEGLIAIRYMNIPLLAATIYYYQQFPIRFPNPGSFTNGRPTVLVHSTENDLTLEIYNRVLGLEQFKKITPTPATYKGFQVDLLRYLPFYIGFLNRNVPTKRVNVLYQDSWRV